VPGGAAARQGDNQQQPARDSNRKSEEIVNYEISRTTKTEVIEGGRVNRISVAVVVDGTYTKNDKGELAYEPRNKEEIDRIAALVRTAIGFDAKRGDQVEVVNLRLAETPSIPIAEPAGVMSMFSFTKEDLMRAIEIAVMALLGLIVLFFGVRPIIRRIFNPAGAAAAGAAIPGAAGAALPGGGAGGGGGHAGGMITTAGGPNVAIVGSDQAVAISNRTSAMIDIAQVQGQVHAQSVQKVGDLVDKNPNETVAVIRQWLHEAAA
jgi:flagellar M-ring protein FliF